MEIEFGFDLEQFDLAVIHQWLTNSYWSPGISRERVEKGFRNSKVVIGAFAEGRQVGVARVVSDTTRFAYIADVFVEEGFRGRGLGREMVRRLMSHPEVADARTWCLFTKDAHGVYESLGFERTRDPDRFMICYERGKAEIQTASSLDEILEAVTPENVHAEIDTGRSMGKEEW
jgi:GNAT superfamily N-acetyltransferase